jgi:hypothetical protein
VTVPEAAPVDTSGSITGTFGGPATAPLAGQAPTTTTGATGGAVAAPADPSDALPFTGAPVGVVGLAVLGCAAVAAGLVALTTGRRQEPSYDVPAEPVPAPDPAPQVGRHAMPIATGAGTVLVVTTLAASALLLLVVGSARGRHRT